MSQNQGEGRAPTHLGKFSYTKKNVINIYEKHPEYIIKPTNREPNLGRGGTQVVLDLSNPKVQDLVFQVVDTLMTNYPEIDYIKWDANAPIMNHGSQYLTKDNQSHLYI